MASANLSKTPGSAGNRKKFNFSFWIKGNDFVSDYMFFSASGSTESAIIFDSSSRLEFYEYNGSSKTTKITTKRVFRDPSAWYHIVVSIDTTQSTSTDRVKIYVNGSQETDLENTTYGAQDFDSLFNNTTTQYIGSNASGGNFDGSMTHIHFNDGYTYDASTFGETDSTSGIWKPKTAPSVTYGSNGYFLKFENSGAMGTDSSGNSNTYAVGGTLTQNVDTPSNNFPTLNSIAPSQDNRTGGNGNLYTGDNSNNSWSSHPATMACESGKWYFEIKDETDWGSTSDSTRRYGIVNLASSSVNQNRASATDVRFSDGDYAYAYMNASGVRHNGSTISGTTSTHPTFAEGDFIMVAMDLDNNKLYFGKNGTWLDSGDPTSGASGTGAVATLASGAWAAYLEPKYGSDTASINFGQGYFRTAVAGTNADANGHGKFKYSVPSGYYAICTKNIKE
jgi:hypothetical protein